MRYLQVFAVVMVVCFSWGAAEVTADDDDNENSPTITEAFADVSAGEVEIIGTNFGTAPTVSLGEQGLLNVTSATDTKIVADLPVGILAGDYLLLVARSSGGDDDDDG